MDHLKMYFLEKGGFSSLTMPPFLTRRVYKVTGKIPMATFFGCLSDLPGAPWHRRWRIWRTIRSSIWTVGTFGFCDLNQIGRNFQGLRTAAVLSGNQPETFRSHWGKSLPNPTNEPWGGLDQHSFFSCQSAELRCTSFEHIPFSVISHGSHCLVDSCWLFPWVWCEELYL